MVVVVRGGARFRRADVHRPALGSSVGHGFLRLFAWSTPQIQNGQSRPTYISNSAPLRLIE